MTVPERLAALRGKMKEFGIDAYMVPTDDFHNSEYVGEYYKCRKYITGFTGSAGVAVIMQDQAGLWTDGRYFLQAEKQLEGSGVTLFKMGEPGVLNINDFLLETLKKGQKLGFDGRTVNAASGMTLSRQLGEIGVTIVPDYDLIGMIWEDRPELSAKPVWTLDTKYCGTAREEKIAYVREKMAGERADYFLLTSLDDIAWLLNIRGDDIECNPVVLSYLIMTPEKVCLYVQTKCISDEIKKQLADAGVELHEYMNVYEDVPKIPAEARVWCDLNAVNYRLASSLRRGVVIINRPNPTRLAKACKNETEIKNDRQAHIRDGVAVTRFIYWLKQNAGKGITECSVAVELEKFRSMTKDYIGPSFYPIIGYAEHAAIIHYSATPETDVPIQPEGSILCDTGGQYPEGTTDITRTVVLGKISDKEKEYFTRALRSNLNLGNAVIKEGCAGAAIDYLAREPFWEIGEDFNHGTGHGVGFCLNVHEGPQRIKYTPDRGGEEPFREGMITSDEPGIYLENEFGIRHENLMLCVKAMKTSCGQFLKFEPLTLVPFDLDGVDPSLMSEKERKLLNEYHKKVWDALSPYFAHTTKDTEVAQADNDAEVLAWLRNAVRAV